MGVAEIHTILEELFEAMRKEGSFFILYVNTTVFRALCENYFLR